MLLELVLMLLLVVCLGIVLYLDVVVMVLLDLFLEICLCKGFFWSFSGLLASCVSERSCWNILRSHKASSLTLCIVCCSSGSFRWSLFLCLASFDSSDLSCSCSTFCCLVSSQCTSSFFSWSAYEASISTSKAFSKGPDQISPIWHFFVSFIPVLEFWCIRRIET